LAVFSDIIGLIILNTTGNKRGAEKVKYNNQSYNSIGLINLYTTGNKRGAEKVK
jgi:hypothetical protein